MNRKKYLNLIKKIIKVLEILLSIILIAAIIISIPDLLKYFIDIIFSSKNLSYDLLQEFLSHVLLLVIGLEFVLMLIAHTDSSVIFLITMVIARKLLIHANTTMDLLIGVFALFVLFLIKKYLITNKVAYDSGIFSPEDRILTINDELHYNIEDRGLETLGELIEALSEEKNIPIKANALLDDRDYIYKVEKMSHGNMEEVRVVKK